MSTAQPINCAGTCPGEYSSVHQLEKGERTSTVANICQVTTSDMQRANPQIHSIIDAAAGQPVCVPAACCAHLKCAAPGTCRQQNPITDTFVGDVAGPCLYSLHPSNAPDCISVCNPCQCLIVIFLACIHASSAPAQAATYFGALLQHPAATNGEQCALAQPAGMKEPAAGMHAKYEVSACSVFGQEPETGVHAQYLVQLGQSITDVAALSARLYSVPYQLLPVLAMCFRCNEV